MLIEPQTFWNVWQSQDVSIQQMRGNLKTVKKLAECRLVCRASRSMIDSWRGQHGLIKQFPSGEAPGWVGEHPLFERYRRNAEENIAMLDDRMRSLWRFPEIPLHISVLNRINLFKWNSQQAVSMLSTSLENHGNHKACVRACLAELSDIVAYAHDNIHNSEYVVLDVIWPLVLVLQAHHGDSSLGLQILLALLQIAKMASSVPDLTAMSQPLISPGRSCVGRRMLSAFYKSCPENKELEQTVSSVRRWLEKPVLLCHSVELHTYVLMYEED